MSYPTRGQINSRIHQLWDYITDNEYSQARITAKKTLGTILKYYKTKGRKCDEEYLYNVFHDIDFTLRNSTNNINKERELYDLIGNVKENLMNNPEDPVEHLKDIYEDLKRQYISAYNGEEGEGIDIGDLQQSLDELTGLGEQMEEKGGRRYNLYVNMLSKIGDCQTILPKVALKAKGKQTVTDISQSFSQLFTSIEKVISPPKPLDLADNKKEITEMIKEGISPDDIADSMGHSREFFRKWMEANIMPKEEEEN